MTPEERAALRALEQAATPGPWTALSDDQGHPAGYEWLVWAPEAETDDYTGFVGGRGEMDETGVLNTSLSGKRDTHLIAAMRNHLLALLAAADRADAETARAEAAEARVAELEAQREQALMEVQTWDTESDEQTGRMVAGSDPTTGLVLGAFGSVVREQCALAIRLALRDAQEPSS